MTKKSNGQRSVPSGPPRAALYRRVSSEKQAEKVSPEIQLSESETYARDHGYMVVAVYSDIEKYRVRGRLVEPSGARVDRPAFVQMLADGAAEKFDVILAWKEDRLYRGVHAAVLVDDLIESSGVMVELVKETFDRKMLFIKAAIGRMELDNIRERTEMGHRERVRSGLIHGGPVPVGYVAIKSKDVAAAVGYELDPDFRGFFDDLARLYLARLPVAEIARRLGPKPHTGKPWLNDELRYIMRNPFYRGVLSYGWQSGEPEFTVPALHAPAWDEATCAAIERERARRTKRRNQPRQALLSGVLRCGICGNMMAAGTTTTHTVNGQHVYRVYGCHRPMLVKDGRWFGRRTHEPNYINENRVVKQLRARFAGMTAADVDEWQAFTAQVLSGATPDDAVRRERLQSEIDRLSERLSDLTIGLNGVRNASPAATEMILAAITSAGKQIDRARLERDAIDGRKRSTPDLALARQAMIRLIEHPELFDGPTDELHQALCTALPALFIRRGVLAEPIIEWQD